MWSIGGLVEAWGWYSDLCLYVSRNKPIVTIGVEFDMTRNVERGLKETGSGYISRRLVHTTHR
jgi:hypothetical protein